MGDSNGLVLKRRHKLAMNKTFYAVQPVIIEKIRSMFHQKPKQHVRDCVTTHRIYQFVRKHVHKKEQL